MLDSSEQVAAVVPRMMDNYLTFWRIMAGCYHGAVEEDGRLAMFATGLPIPYFNPAAILAWPDDPIALVERVRDFAQRRGCLSMIATWGEIATRFLSRFHSDGGEVLLGDEALRDLRALRVKLVSPV